MYRRERNSRKEGHKKLTASNLPLRIVNQVTRSDVFLTMWTIFRVPIRLSQAAQKLFFLTTLRSKKVTASFSFLDTLVLRKKFHYERVTFSGGFDETGQDLWGTGGCHFVIRETHRLHCRRWEEVAALRGFDRHCPRWNGGCGRGWKDKLAN